jgi:hypothetical protein
MFLRHARITAAALLTLVSTAAIAHADLLWDQSAISTSPSAPSVVNSRLTGFGGGNYYTVEDVTVPAGGWTITSITEYFSNYTLANMQTKAPNGLLIYFPKTASVPNVTPTTTQVALTWTSTTISNQPVYVCAANNLNVVLAPGDYWITVSPIQSVDNFNGNNEQWPSTTHYGNDCATYSSGSSWSNTYPGYDGAFRIDGALGSATPTRSGTWGALKALYH